MAFGVAELPTEDWTISCWRHWMFDFMYSTWPSLWQIGNGLFSIHILSLLKRRIFRWCGMLCGLCDSWFLCVFQNCIPVIWLMLQIILLSVSGLWMWEWVLCPPHCQTLIIGHHVHQSFTTSTVSETLGWVIYFICNLALAANGCMFWSFVVKQCNKKEKCHVMSCCLGYWCERASTTSAASFYHELVDQGRMRFSGWLLWLVAVLWL